MPSKWYIVFVERLILLKIILHCTLTLNIDSKCSDNEMYCEAIHECVPRTCPECESFKSCQYISYLRECKDSECTKKTKCVDYCSSNSTDEKQCEDNITKCEGFFNLNCKEFNFQYAIYCSNSDQCVQPCSLKNIPGCFYCSKNNNDSNCKSESTSCDVVDTCSLKNCTTSTKCSTEECKTEMNIDNHNCNDSNNLCAKSNIYPNIQDKMKISPGETSNSSCEFDKKYFYAKLFMSSSCSSNKYCKAENSSCCQVTVDKVTSSHCLHNRRFYLPNCRHKNKSNQTNYIPCPFENWKCKLKNETCGLQCSVGEKYCSRLNSCVNYHYMCEGATGGQAWVAPIISQSGFVIESAYKRKTDTFIQNESEFTEEVHNLTVIRKAGVNGKWSIITNQQSKRKANKKILISAGTVLNSRSKIIFSPHRYYYQHGTAVLILKYKSIVYLLAQYIEPTTSMKPMFRTISENSPFKGVAKTMIKSLFQSESNKFSEFIGKSAQREFYEKAVKEDKQYNIIYPVNLQFIPKKNESLNPPILINSRPQVGLSWKLQENDELLLNFQDGVKKLNFKLEVKEKYNFIVRVRIHKIVFRFKRENFKIVKKIKARYESLEKPTQKVFKVKELLKSLTGEKVQKNDALVVVYVSKNTSNGMWTFKGSEKNDTWKQFDLVFSRENILNVTLKKLENSKTKIEIDLMYFPLNYLIKYETFNNSSNQEFDSTLVYGLSNDVESFKIVKTNQPELSKELGMVSLKFQSCKKNCDIKSISSKIDCNGVENGEARVECGVCIGGNTGLKSLYDCAHVCNGTSIFVKYRETQICKRPEDELKCQKKNEFLNSCGFCVDDSSSTKGQDQCGVCKGNNKCLGCDDIPYSGKVFDSCGKCRSKSNKKFNFCAKIKKIIPSIIDLAFGLKEWKLKIRSVGLDKFLEWKCYLKNENSNYHWLMPLMKSRQGFAEGLLDTEGMKEGKYEIICRNPSSTTPEITYNDFHIIDSNMVNFTSEIQKGKNDRQKIVLFKSSIFINDKDKRIICGLYNEHKSKLQFSKSKRIDTNTIRCTMRRLIPGKYNAFVVFGSRRSWERKSREEFDMFVIKKKFINREVIIKGQHPEIMEAVISDDLRSIIISFDERISADVESCHFGILIDGTPLEDNCKIKISGTKLIVNVFGSMTKLLEADAKITLLKTLKIIPEGSDYNLINSEEILVTTLKSANNPIKPRFMLSGYNVICKTDKTGIDVFVTRVTGDGGLGLTYTWNISDSTSVMKVDDYITSDEKELHIPMDELKSPYYLISVVGCNKASICSEDVTKGITIDRDKPFVVSLLGPTTIYPDRQYDFEAEIELCEADLRLENVTFKWNLVPSNDIVDRFISKESSNVITFPQYSLNGNNIYTLEIKVYSAPLNTSIFSSIDIEANLLDLEARISTDSLIAHPEDRIKLDGSNSFDPGNENADVSFYWTCQTLKKEQGCYVAISGERFETFLGDKLNNCTLEIEPGILSPNTYLMTLNMLKNYRNMSTIVKLEISTGQYLLPKIEIRMPRMIYADYNSETSIIGLVTSSEDVTCEFQSLDEDDFAHAKFSEKSHLLICPCNNYPVTTYVRLQDDSKYRFKLECKHLEASDKEVMKSTFELKTYALPLTRPFMVTEQNETEMVKKYEVRITEWIDDPMNIPITYTFGYISKSNEKIVIKKIRSGRIPIIKDLILPTGSVIVFVEGCNAMLICATRELTVNIEREEFSKKLMSNEMLEEVEKIKFKNKDEVDVSSSLSKIYSEVLNLEDPSNLSYNALEKIRNVYDIVSKSINDTSISQEDTSSLIQKLLHLPIKIGDELLLEIISNLVFSNWNIALENSGKVDPEISINSLQEQIKIIVEGLSRSVINQRITEISELFRYIETISIKICERVERQINVHIKTKHITLASKHVTFSKTDDKIDNPDDGLGSIELKQHMNGKDSQEIPYRSQLSTFKISHQLASLLLQGINLVSAVAHASLAARPEDVIKTDLSKMYLVIYDLDYHGSKGDKNPKCKYWNNTNVKEPPFWDDTTCLTAFLTTQVKCICLHPGTVAVFNDGKGGDIVEGEIQEEYIYELRLEADYNKTVRGNEVAFSSYIQYQLSFSLGIPVSQIEIVDIFEGSVDIIFKIQSSSENPITKEEATELLKEKIQSGELDLKDLNNNDLQVLGLTSDKTVKVKRSEQTRDLLPVILGVVFGIALIIIFIIVIAAYIMKKKRRNDQKIGPESNEEQAPTYQSFEFEPVLAKYTTPVKKMGGDKIYMAEFKPEQSPPSAFSYKIPTKNTEVTTYISDVVNSSYEKPRHENRQFEENFDELNSSYHHDLFPVILDEDEFKNRLPYRENHM